MMRTRILLLLLLPVFTQAQQKFHITLFGGAGNYQGDLQSRTLTLNQSNLALGAGLKYDFTPNWAIRGSFNYTRLGADDKFNSGILKARNLNFQTKLREFNVLGEFTLFDLEEKRISPYAFAGIALFHFNPYTHDTLGNKHFLQPLSTEGQGLSIYPDREKYKLTQFAIPFGAGIKFRVTQNAVLAYEIGFRKLFTDHLDDLSTTYVDPVVLVQERGEKAYELSYRGGELKDGDPNYPQPLSQRGASQRKDWYYMQGVSLFIGIGRGNGEGLFNRNKTGVECPAVL